MDIVVTIPKSEYLNDIHEDINILENGHNAFWTLSKIPRKLNIGDRIFFVKNNKIETSMRVVDILKDSTMLCETTNRTWSGRCQLILDDLRNERVQHMKGFQGFRYMQ